MMINLVTKKTYSLLLNGTFSSLMQLQTLSKGLEKHLTLKTLVKLLDVFKVG